MKRYIFLVVTIFLIVCLFGYLSYEQRILKTRFTLHALGRYLHAYEIVEGKKIRSFSDLPDVRLVSYSSSLQLDMYDLKSRVLNGFFYDFKSEGKEGFVISASPLKVYFFSVEFGMTEDLNLRVNSRHVDIDPDSYKDVKQWPIVPEWFNLQTLPAR